MFEMVDVTATQGAVAPEAVLREVACLAQRVADPGVPLFERFQVSVRLGRLVEAVQAQVLCDLARQHGWDETDQYDMDEARWVRCGADPDALVDEDLPLEVAVAMGVGVNTAMCVLQDVINLQARHPRAWAMVTKGQVALFRARRVAEACSQVDLDKTETGLCFVKSKLPVLSLGICQFELASFSSLSV